MCNDGIDSERHYQSARLQMQQQKSSGCEERGTLTLTTGEVELVPGSEG